MQKETRFFELIRLQGDSGLSVREFCSNEGIAYSTFYYWRKKLHRKESGRKK
ncbi:transposase [Bacteroidota bacterium]